MCLMKLLTFEPKSALIHLDEEENAVADLTSVIRLLLKHNQYLWTGLE